MAQILSKRDTSIRKGNQNKEQNNAKKVYNVNVIIYGGKKKKN